MTLALVLVALAVGACAGVAGVGLWARHRFPALWPIVVGRAHAELAARRRRAQERYHRIGW